MAYQNRPREQHGATDTGPAPTPAAQGFNYDPDARKVRIPDADLLAGLRRFAASGARPFGMKQFSQWPDRPFAPHTVLNRFGSWRKAMRLVGVEGVRGRRYDPAELVANLERVWREMGRAPGAVTLVQRGEFSAAAYRRRWGSVQRLCRLVAQYHRGQITREQLLRAGPDDGPRAHRRKDVPLDARWRILKRGRYRCAACGKSPATDPTVELQVDHVIPVAKGGGNDDANLRTLCAKCNQGKSDEA